MLSTSIFLDIKKVADLILTKNADVSGIQVVYHVIYLLFGSSLGKV